MKRRRRRERPLNSVLSAVAANGITAQVTGTAGGGQSEGANGGRRPTGREGQVKREGLLPLPRAPDEKSLPALARFEHFHFALLDSLKPDKHGIDDLEDYLSSLEVESLPG